MLQGRGLKLSLLVVGASVISKLAGMKDVFYVPMQQAWGLTNTQIGLGFTVYSIVQMTGLILCFSVIDRFPKRVLMSVGFLGLSCFAFFFSTLPDVSAYVIAFGCMAFFSDVLYWPLMLKSISALGSRYEQGRLFAIMEAGSGLLDVALGAVALWIFTIFGEGREGLSAAMTFYGCLIFSMSILNYIFTPDDTADEEEEEEEDHTFDDLEEHDYAYSSEISFWAGIKFVITRVNLWLAAFTTFFVYCAYTGLTSFMPFLRDIYHLPVSMIAMYGIVLQYALKLVGSPIGGLLADKVFHSPTRYLRISFIASIVVMSIILVLPHESMSYYSGIAITLLFATVIFSQRSVYFAPMDEIGIRRRYAGAAMSLGCLIGYMPILFGYTLYGMLLDHNPGMTGYRYVFACIIGFSIMGFITSTILSRRLRDLTNRKVVHDIDMTEEKQLYEVLQDQIHQMEYEQDKDLNEPMAESPSDAGDTNNEGGSK